MIKIKFHSRKQHVTTFQKSNLGKGNLEGGVRLSHLGIATYVKLFSGVGPEIAELLCF